MANTLKNNKKDILESPTLAKVFINPKTNELFRQEDVIKRFKLVETLEIIKKEGVRTMYNKGTVARLIVQDIQVGGIITMEDFMCYNVRWEKPVTTKFKMVKCFTPFRRQQVVLSLRSL